MKFHIQVQVDGTKATVGEMPFLAEGSEGAVGCAFTFDGSWDGFSRTALLRRAGEPTLTLPLDEEDVCALPAVFTADSTPFYLSAEGTDGACRLRTNEVCLAFRRGVREGTRIAVYEGPYLLQQNRTSYPTAGRLLTEDLTVDIPVTDTSADTVTASVLLQGYTAHDAQGQPVTGTYQPVDLSADTVTPGALLQGYTAHDARGLRITGMYEPPSVTGPELNAVYSESPPADTAKLWVKTGITPQKESVGYLGGEETVIRYDLGEEASLSASNYFDGGDGSFCIYGRTYNYNGGSGYFPRIMKFRSDGTVESCAIGTGSSSEYDWYALSGCMSGGCVYLLLGYGSTSSSTTNKRATKLYRYDPETQTGKTLVTVDSTLYYGLYGGMCATDDGTVYLYTKTKTSSDASYITRFYKYANGTLSRIGSDLTGYENGSSGSMAKVGGRLYTPIHNADGVALRVNPEVGTVETWQLAATGTTLSFRGEAGAYIKVSDSYGISWLDPLTGVTTAIPLYTGPSGFFLTHSHRGWIVNGTTVFAVCYHINGYYEYLLLPRTSELPAATLYRKEESGTLCTVVSTASTSVQTELYGALATDADGYWQPAELYRYADCVWTPIGAGTPVIAFTVNGTLCHAEQGMTWEQFLASAYNTSGLALYEGYVQYADGSYVVTVRDGAFREVLSGQSYDVEVYERVKPEEEIVAGADYLQYIGTVGTYAVSVTLTDASASADNPTQLSTLDTAALTFTAADGYMLSETASVDGAAYCWDAESGTLLLAMPFGDVTVGISADGYFTLDGRVLHAESGQTWLDWTATAANTAGVYLNAGGMVCCDAADGTPYTVYLSGAAVGCSTVISLGAAYTLGTYVD